MSVVLYCFLQLIVIAMLDHVHQVYFDMAWISKPYESRTGRLEALDDVMFAKVNRHSILATCDEVSTTNKPILIRNHIRTGSPIRGIFDGQCKSTRKQMQCPITVVHDDLEYDNTCMYFNHTTSCGQKVMSDEWQCFGSTGDDSDNHYLRRKTDILYSSLPYYRTTFRISGESTTGIEPEAEQTSNDGASSDEVSSTNTCKFTYLTKCLYWKPLAVVVLSSDNKARFDTFAVITNDCSEYIKTNGNLTLVGKNFESKDSGSLIVSAATYNNQRHHHAGKLPIFSVSLDYSLNMTYYIRNHTISGLKGHTSWRLPLKSRIVDAVYGNNILLVTDLNVQEKTGVFDEWFILNYVPDILPISLLIMKNGCMQENIHLPETHTDKKILIKGNVYGQLTYKQTFRYFGDDAHCLFQAKYSITNTGKVVTEAVIHLSSAGTRFIAADIKFGNFITNVQSSFVELSGTLHAEEEATWNIMVEIESCPRSDIKNASNIQKSTNH